MVSQDVELSDTDIQYVPRGSIKSQSMSDFVAEFSSLIDEETPPQLTLSIDDASNMKGRGAGIILEWPGYILIEQVMKFDFKASNNQAQYEALIVDMVLALEMRASPLKFKSDS